MKNWTRYAIAALAISALGLTATVATAKGKGGPGKRACKADVERLCPDAKGDREAVRQCLVEQRAQLSESCQEDVNRHEERRQAFEQACGADAQRLCGEAQGRQLHQCMRDNKDDISESCQSFLQEQRGKHKGKRGERGQQHAAVKAACQEDAQRLCADAQGRERRQCMRDHEEELSDPCRAAIEDAKQHRKGNQGGQGR